MRVALALGKAQGGRAFSGFRGPGCPCGALRTVKRSTHLLKGPILACLCTQSDSPPDIYRQGIEEVAKGQGSGAVGNKVVTACHHL